MGLFQQSVLEKYLKQLDDNSVRDAYKKFQDYFHNPDRQANIRAAKEEQFQEGFLRELFVKILGYTINPEPDYNLTSEFKNENGAKKADGAILADGKAIGVIELKGTDTKDLDKINTQAFSYKNNQSSCIYVITSNFEKLRFFIHNAVDHEEFNLFELTEDKFKLLWVCLQKDNLLAGIPEKIKEESLLEEEKVTKSLYADYSSFKHELWQDMVKRNPEYEELLLFKKSQKLLDRFLFILFSEDKGLLPPNSISEIVNQWQDLKELDEYRPLYDRYKKYFGYMNKGFKGKKYEIPAYNGGLFCEDEVLDSVKIDDEVLRKHTMKLTEYDFNTDVDVNILGHIFEHSLSEIENVRAQLEGIEVDKSKSKRKKDGVFYTPKYITKYIVDNTVGKLCEEKKEALGITDERFREAGKRTRKGIQDLEEYREWLLGLTICDPACGSGAFLNQALAFLINEHTWLDELVAEYHGSKIVFPDVEKHILENNLFGVDINEESIEIAKLSLWLRTAKQGRKLTTLSDNIKCGNSLIDDPEVAGDKAFKWEKEFSEIFAKGGFDVVIGNPPYGASVDSKEIYSKKFGFKKKTDTYQMFTVLANELICNNGITGLIIPNSWMTRKAGEEFRSKLNNFRFETVLDFITQVFEDANIDTCIIIYGKKNTNNHVVYASKVLHPNHINDDLELHAITFNNWVKVDKFNCELTDAVFKLFEKLNTSSQKLGNLSVITGGYKPYQVGYGKSIEGNFSQTQNDVKNRVYHSETQIDDSYYPDIKGLNIDRYNIKQNTQWVKWGDWLMSPKKFTDFVNPKLVVREVTGKNIYACYDDFGYFTNDTTHMVRGADSNNLLYYLAIINSTLMGWYFRVNFGESNDLFPKIKVNELKELPIKAISTKSQQLFFEKTVGILKLNKKLQNISFNFQKYIQSQFSIEKLSNKLQTWYKLDFGDFIKELNKSIKKVKGVKLSKIVEMEWMELFEEKKAETDSLKAEIDKTDKEIDTMVYELYGLTEEEIKIVENN